MAIKRPDWNKAKLGVSKSKYPWHEWMDGDVWEIEAQKDFTCQYASFVTLSHDVARKRGGKVRTKRLRNGNVLLQFKGKS